MHAPVIQRFVPSCVTVVLVAIALYPVQIARCDEIIAIITRANPDTRRVLEGVKSVCSGTKIVEYDMKGSAREGKRIIEKIRRRTQSGSPMVLLTLGAPATKLAQDSLANARIFYSLIINPPKKGIVGDNIRGIALDTPIKVQLQKLKTILPNVKRVGIIYDPKHSDNVIEEAERSVSDLGLTLVARQVSSPKHVPRAMRGMVGEIDALLIIADRTVVNNDSFRFIITTTLENRIPTVTYSKYLVKAGFLFCLSAEPYSIGKQAGNIVCNPRDPGAADSPVMVAPETFEFVINLKTAKRIALDIDSEILAAADAIYQ